MIRLRWPNALSLTLLTALALVYFRPPADLDFCWQIRTGERILDTGHIRQPDPFSYTIAGKDVPDHEWLYEIALAATWRTLGHAGLKLARVVLFFVPVLVLARQLRQRGVAVYAVSISVILAIVVLFFFERLRPMVCSTLGLQLVAGWLHDHVRGQRSLDWKLPVTMLLWGNLHPAVIMGQALLLGAIGWECLAAWPRIPGRLLFWSLAGLAASFVTPAPLDRLRYPFAPELRHPAQRLFEEIMPPWKHLAEPPFTLWLVLLLAVVFSAVMVVRWRQFRGWEWALLLAVAGLAATATRGIGDWLLITAALAVPQIGHLLKVAPSAFLKIDRAAKRVFGGLLFRPQPAWPVIGVALLLVGSLPPWGRLAPNRERASWPHEVVDWIESGGLPSQEPWRIFSGINEGSYLIWRLPGRALVHTDTRGFYYPGEMLEDSFYLPQATEDWPRRFDRVLARGTEYFLLPTEGGLWLKLKPHVQQPLYCDEKSVVLSAEQVRAAIAQVIWDRSMS